MSTIVQIQEMIISLRDNRTGDITPAQIRSILTAMLDFVLDTQPFSEAVLYTDGIQASAVTPQTLVIYNDVLYVCVVSHLTTLAFNPDNWEQVSPSLGDIYPTQLNSFMASIPTSPTGLNVGDWWNNSGILTQVQ